MTTSRSTFAIALTLVLVLGLGACAGDAADDGAGEAEDTEVGADDVDDGASEEDQDEALTVYSGRNEELIGPLIEQYTEDTGVEVEVRYGDTAELAATILEEGDASPADVFFAQDAGALGAIEQAGGFTTLDDAVVDRVEERFASAQGSWVGVSGRARVIAYNTDEVEEADVPTSVLDLTDDEYAGRVGWAPTNGSFQSFVTAMRVELGEDETADWLAGMIDNDVAEFENNTTIVEAVGRGEVDYGLVNHYYLYRYIEEDPDFPVGNSFAEDGDVGALINVAGVGILQTSDQPELAAQFVEYLLDDDAQTYFSEETAEYPLASGVEATAEGLPPLESVTTPEVDLTDLEDLEGTLDLLREQGALT